MGARQRITLSLVKWFARGVGVLIPFLPLRAHGPQACGHRILARGGDKERAGSSGQVLVRYELQRLEDDVHGRTNAAKRTCARQR